MEEVAINIATSEKPLKFTYNLSSCSAEELCNVVCRKLRITPLARSLFSLQIFGTKVFVSNNSLLEKNTHFNLRLRIKVFSITRLKQLDKEAYNYYFHQVRKDVLENNVPEIIYSKYREELLGLGITDMYRVMVEEKKTQQDVMKDYKKYIPKEVTKKHSIFTKKPIYNTLFQLQKNDLSSSFIVEQYLNQLDILAPNYLSEDYKVTLDKNGSLYDGTIYIMPFHKEQPGLRILYDKENSWEYLCQIDELCFMTIRKDGTIEISRLNGIPLYFKFSSVGHMNSFVSACDGYYRHMVKWTFNICKDIHSPLLKFLHNMKCHGPVGGEFSYHKLEEKRSNRPGSFILRQCEQEYDVYYIDVCSKFRSKPVTYKIEYIAQDEFILDGNVTKKYKNINEIINEFKDPDDELYLQECLPPSEYDKSQLLLCRPPMPSIASHIDDNDLESVLSTTKGPRCIDNKELQLYKGSRIEGSEKVSYFYKVRWNVTQGKKIDMAMKMLKQDVNEKILKEFIDQAGQWAFLKTTAVVKLYGVTLKPVSMIMEYLPFGPLDNYLRENSDNVQIVDLVEASATLATALWHLAENGIIHGRIRCRKLLVGWHDSSKFTVKLSDHGQHSSYKEYDIHWIPMEYYNNMELVRKSTSADVWAYATTLWEIFSMGKSPNEIGQPLTKKNYLGGNRLNIPNGCPKEIYSIMRGCWHGDPHNRSRPQVIMRDVNHLLYQVFNSRRVHSYATIFSKFIAAAENSENSFLALGDVEEYHSNYNSQRTSLTDDGLLDDDTMSCLSNPVDYEFSNRKNKDNTLQDIYEFEGYNVILQGLIGKGFYGLVFKGSLQKDGSCESREVAVKKLISNTESSQLDDFDQEIKIAKTLKHRNIVEILGVVDKPEILLIMEFIQHGSLKSYLNIHRTTITKMQLLNYSLDVACGMEYLETMQVVHRDLAARNILVVSKDHVKISDFGLARKTDPGGYYVLKSSNRALPLNWYAPESKSMGKFSSKSDVWSYGITLWEMFSFGMEPPPWDPENCNERMPSNLQCPKFCPVEIYRDLMVKCWEYIPMERPSFTQLCVCCQKLLSEHTFT